MRPNGGNGFPTSFKPTEKELSMHPQPVSQLRWPNVALCLKAAVIILPLSSVALAQTLPPPGTEQNAVIIVIDGSGSFDQQEFADQLEYVVECFDADGPISSDGTWALAVLQFSDGVTTEIGLTLIDSVTTRDLLAQQVRAITQRRGGTRPGPALIEAKAQLENGNLDAQRFVMFFTDGTTGQDEAVVPASDLRNMVGSAGQFNGATVCMVHTACGSSDEQSQTGWRAIANDPHPFDPGYPYNVPFIQYDEPLGTVKCISSSADVDAPFCEECFCKLGTACGDPCHAAQGFYPDCDDDGIPDWCDEMGGCEPGHYACAIGHGWADCNTNGVPDQCEEPPVVYVDHAATGANDGTSWQHAYLKLEDALSDGFCTRDGQIWVAEGVYSPPTITGYTVNQSVAIYGGFQNGDAFADRNPVAHETILSGDIIGDDAAGWLNRSDNARTVMEINAGRDADILIDGFTITGGYTPSSYAGGIYIRDDRSSSWSPRTVTLANCYIHGNRAKFGGGIYNGTEYAAVILDDCVIKDNQADDGGGLCNYSSIGSLELSNCVIQDNQANYGGGLSNYSNTGTLKLSDCVVQDNQADTGGGLNNFAFYGVTEMDNCVIKGNQAIRGGGIYTLGPLVLTRCRVSENVSSGSTYDAPDGGGLNADNTQVTISHCEFRNNSARWGAGIYSGFYSDVYIWNTLITGNTSSLSAGGRISDETYGGGVDVFNNSSITIGSCTIVNNHADDFGGGIGGRNNVDVTVINSIVWGNTSNVSGPQVGLDNPSNIIITYSDIQGGQPGMWVFSPYSVVYQNNIDLDPGLDSRFEIDGSSPCLDAGDPTTTSVGLLTTDLEGEARFFDGDGNGLAVIDMGVDEATRPRWPCVTCDVCGAWRYQPPCGDPDNGIEPGTFWQDVPEDYVCPICGSPKEGGDWVPGSIQVCDAPCEH